jgi:multidrug resistance efflux pump
MKNRQPEIIYSDPVKDIISNPPRRIIRWGTTIIFSVVAVLLAMSWLIRYPDIIRAQVEITTVNPPVTLITKKTGRINKLCVNDGQNVSSGQLLAVMETAASVQEVQSLGSSIDTIKKPENTSVRLYPPFTDLGELQNHYAAFIKTLSDYNTYIENDFYGSKILSTAEEIKSIQEYINHIKVKDYLFSENFELEKNKYSRDSVLYSQKVLSPSDIEKSKQALIRINLELQQIRLDHSAKAIELAEKRQLLQDYNIQRQEEKEKLLTLMNEAFMNLKAQIRIWKIDYLLLSPVNGTVTFIKYWSENQTVAEGEPVLYVVPEDAGEMLGRTSLKMQRSGKVKIGYTVNLKLSSFPYLEYGMVRGTVRSKSLVSSGNEYMIEISLPDGLTTLYGNKLEFTQNMQGTAEIITEDIRLLQKIVNPFRYMVSKNKKILSE